MTGASTSPPARLAVAVAFVAGAMLMLEIVVTRLFSVLFFNHFSFFAVSLVMAGLVLGGIWAARTDAGSLTPLAFGERLSRLGSLFSAWLVGALVLLCLLSRVVMGEDPSLLTVAVCGLIFLPGLVAAGAFLALAFARSRDWIGTLYACDLVAAAVARISSIWALRTLQGPGVLLVPATLAALAGLTLAGERAHRTLAGALAAGCLVLAGLNAASGNMVFRFTPEGSFVPYFERWNEHSRIAAVDLGTKGRYLIIDRSASTLMPSVPPAPDGTPVVPQPWWRDGFQYSVYATGRPVRNVAIIGVGGGGDLLPALWHGAGQVDGYELNSTFIDLLERDFRDFNAVVTRPEVRLIHGEARVGIAHSGQQYDVIQASLIDTWAATASGGFVLSENSLYTKEGWQVFLSHLTPSGILTMTRWHLPDAPAETHRLVALASASLSGSGIDDPSRHVVLIHTTRNATILVSRAPFEPGELEGLRQWCGENDGEILAAPGTVSPDPVIDRLLDPATRDRTIAESVFNIAPPDDSRPYFFLQVRPWDVLSVNRSQFGGVGEITVNGVRVMLILCASSLLLMAIVMLLSVFSLPGAHSGAGDRRRYRLMSLYFSGIGLGYILVQLGLHQRIIIILGHPTTALSVVLFSMLLGTGVGAALSERVLPRENVGRAFAIILGSLSVLWLSFPFFQAFEGIASTPVRYGAICAVLIAVGGVLGLAFPFGVRLVAPTGEWAVQKMWAINGAASIAGSVLAALTGLSAGTRNVVLAGLLAYAVAAVAAVLSVRQPSAPTAAEAAESGLPSS